MTHGKGVEKKREETKEDNIIWDEAGKSIVRTGIKREGEGERGKTKVRS